MEPTTELPIMDLNGGDTAIVIPKPAKGHLYRTHPNSEFRLFHDHHQLCEILDSAKPFAECKFKDDYIILQMMQYEDFHGMLVEFLRFGNLKGKLTDPTCFDLAPWVPMEKERPVDGQMVIVYKGKITESGERVFINLHEGKYHADDIYMNKNKDSQVVYWKPLSAPEGFSFP